MAGVIERVFDVEVIEEVVLKGSSIVYAFSDK